MIHAETRYKDQAIATPVDNDAIATPALVEAMLKDVGIEDPEINEAAKKYCLNYIEGWNEVVENPEIDGMTVGELVGLVNAFESGWRAARTGICSPV